MFRDQKIWPEMCFSPTFLFIWASLLNLDNLFLPEENLFLLGIPVVVVHRLYVATCAQKCYLIYHSEENVTRHSMWSSINKELG